MLGINKKDVYWGIKILSLGIVVGVIAIALRNIFQEYTVPIVYASNSIIVYLMIKTIRKTDWKLLWKNK